MLKLMSPAFETAFVRLLREEGGFVKHRADNGGATNFGISLRFLKSVQPDATEETIRALTQQQAKELYYRYFWLSSYDVIPQDVANRVFSMSVVSGQVEAAKCLQRALRACGHDLKDDGIIGNRTVAAVRTTATAILLPALRSEIAAHFRCIVARDKSQRVFLDGWLNRAYSKD